MVVLKQLCEYTGNKYTGINTLIYFKSEFIVYELYVNEAVIFLIKYYCTTKC